MNESYQITGKGEAFLAYIEAQEEAASLGEPEGFGEALEPFEDNIYKPIERHVALEIITGVVEEAAEEICHDAAEPTLREVDRMALAIGEGLINTYVKLSEEAGRA